MFAAKKSRFGDVYGCWCFVDHVGDDDDRDGGDDDGNIHEVLSRTLKKAQLSSSRRVSA